EKGIFVYPNPSPFEYPKREVEIKSLSPQFLSSQWRAYPTDWPAHSDWSVVTRQSPAQPGEIVHFYLTGVGPVYPPVTTGDPASASPLRRGQRNFRLLGGDDQNSSANFLFWGLAPGMMGVYQLDARFPATPIAGHNRTLEYMPLTLSTQDNAVRAST